MRILTPRVLSVLSGVLLLLWPGRGLFGAELPWRRLEAPHFTVYSQQDDAATRAWAEEFNQFIAALHRVLNVDEDALPPLTVVLFRKADDFQPYVPLLRNGKPMDVGGFFSRVSSWGVIGVSPFAEAERDQRVIFHEGVHWYLSATRQRRPLALEEGLAELFSTFRIEQGKEYFGYPIPYHLALLRQQELHLLPVGELLAVTTFDPLAANHGIGLFYAEAWAFVHYLYCGSGPTGPAQLNRLLRGFAERKPVSEGLDTVFGPRAGSLTLALRSYVHGGNYNISYFPTDSAAKIDWPIEPAPPAAVEVALARLSGSHPDLWARHAAAAVALAPTDPAGHDLQAYLLEVKKRHREAIDEATRAVQLGSRDGTSWWLAAEGRFFTDHNLAGAVEACDRSIAFGPGFVPAIDFRGTMEEYLGRDTDALRDFTSVLELSPGNPAALTNRAVLRQVLGDDAGALDDYDASIQCDPGEARHTKIDRSLMLRRLHRGHPQEELAAAMTRWSPSWAKEIGRYLIHEITEAEFMAEAGNGPPIAVRVQRCEAAYFAGMQHLLEGDSTGAEALFKKSLSAHVPYSPDTTLARGELTRLAPAKPMEN